MNIRGGIAAAVFLGILAGAGPVRAVTAWYVMNVTYRDYEVYDFEADYFCWTGDEEFCRDSYSDERATKRTSIFRLGLETAGGIPALADVAVFAQRGGKSRVAVLPDGRVELATGKMPWSYSDILTISGTLGMFEDAGGYGAAPDLDLECRREYRSGSSRYAGDTCLSFAGRQYNDATPLEVGARGPWGTTAARSSDRYLMEFTYLNLRSSVRRYDDYESYVSAIPLPPAGLLLAAGVFAMAAASRRRWHLR
jgi:hypothetical protein